MGVGRSGPAFATILGAGGWGAAGYKDRLSLLGDEENPLDALLTNIENGLDADDPNLDNDGSRILSTTTEGSTKRRCELNDI